jgi:hypothetical protein
MPFVTLQAFLNELATYAIATESTLVEQLQHFSYCNKRCALLPPVRRDGNKKRMMEENPMKSAILLAAALEHF